MAGSVFIRAGELAQELGISKQLAYKMIHNWNEELKKKGFTTVAGRVSRKYYQVIIPGCQPTRVAVERTLAALEAIPRQPRFSAL